MVMSYDLYVRGLITAHIHITTHELQHTGWLAHSTADSLGLCTATRALFELIPEHCCLLLSRERREWIPIVVPPIVVPITHSPVPY